MHTDTLVKYGYTSFHTWLCPCIKKWIPILSENPSSYRASKFLTTLASCTLARIRSINQFDFIFSFFHILSICSFFQQIMRLPITIISSPFHSINKVEVANGGENHFCLQYIISRIYTFCAHG